MMVDLPTSRAQSFYGSAISEAILQHIPHLSDMEMTSLVCRYFHSEFLPFRRSGGGLRTQSASEQKHGPTTGTGNEKGRTSEKVYHDSCVQTRTHWFMGRI